MTAVFDGIPTHSEGRSEQPATSHSDCDRALADLRESAHDWARLALADRRAILREMKNDLLAVAEEWAEAVRVHEGHPAGSPEAGEEWLTGPYMVMRNLRLLEEALVDVEERGAPRIPGAIRTRGDGRVTARVFPSNVWDRIFYPGVTADVWMQDGVTRDSLPETQAVVYREDPRSSGVALVLGGGNVSSIGPMDALYKLFVENRVVLYKSHTVNDFLGPILLRAFQALVDWSVFRIVYGGADVGAYLCEHDQVDEIHITGSDKTVEAIVFGTGEGGARRKAENRPRNTRPISSELGNVSAVVVVPGPWSDGDVDYHAQSIAGMIVNNAGFNCNAARVVVQHAGWDRRRDLVDGIRRVLSRTPSRDAWYPGAADRWALFAEAHPEADDFGEREGERLPWKLVTGVDPSNDDEICFHTEAFCGLCAETALEADSPAEFVRRAVEFANERLWGTLNITWIVHPASLRERETKAAFDRALDDLRYGTISINSWAALGYGLVSTPWGAPPGHTLDDIQSGNGVVHNTPMFDRVEKTVIRTPFRMFPKPVWFPTHATALPLARKLTEFERAPSATRLPGIFWEALRG